MSLSKLSLEERIARIEDRNGRVEQDKAWEISWTRRISIVLLTYLVVATYLATISNDRPFVNALVPAIGYLLSTLVLTSIRRIFRK